MKDEKHKASERKHTVNDLEFIIKQQHKRNLGLQKKESEWEHTKNQLDGTKQIVTRRIVTQTKSQN